tara:strand:+ start:4084 stop:4239 length:156 start_codon:yes stop_codon:yes gene_type:complete
LKQLEHSFVIAIPIEIYKKITIKLARSIDDKKIKVIGSINTIIILYLLYLL